MVLVGGMGANLGGLKNYREQRERCESLERKERDICKSLKKGDRYKDVRFKEGERNFG